MTVEIFSVSGSDSVAVRTLGNVVQLEGTGDVYFGESTPGIAFYEKTGRDLNVTLLDGQEVLLRNFFVVDEQGGVSRLLRGPEGAVEVTGMLAPEPFVPVEDEETEEDVAAPVEEPLEEQAGVGEAMADASAPVEASGEGDGAGGGGIFGLSMEQIGVGLATASVAAVSVGGFSGGGDGDSASQAAPASDTDKQADADGSDAEPSPDAGPDEAQTGLFAVIDELVGLQLGGLTDVSETAMTGGIFASEAESSGATETAFVDVWDDNLGGLLDFDPSAEG